MPQGKLAEMGIELIGGAYVDLIGNDVSNQRCRCAIIDVTEKNMFYVDLRETDPCATGKIHRTNLFRQDAGWRWIEPPKGYGEITTLVSVESCGKHYYSLRAEFPGGLTLTRYPSKPSEPRLRPTARGAANPYGLIGEIVARGRKHSVWRSIVIFGGPI